MSTKILLAGEGGQGIQIMAKVISHAAQKSGKEVTYLPSFGVEQRGGVSLAFIQISTDKIPYPRFATADIVVAFSNRSITSIKDYLSDKSLLIYDGSTIDQESLDLVKKSVSSYISVSANEIAKTKFTSKSANMILLGAISAEIEGISGEEFKSSIVEELASKINKNPEIKDMNLNAFDKGAEIAKNFNQVESKFVGAQKKEIKQTFEKDKIIWSRFPEYCKGCSLCILRCPVGALQFSEDVNFLGLPMPIVDMEKCIGCGKCMQICPDGAIRVDK